MIVRSGDERDLLAVATVHVAASEAVYRGVLPDEFLDHFDVARRREALASFLAAGDRSLLVAVDQNDIIGFAVIGPARDEDVNDDTGELYSLYVVPARWASGVGKRLEETACRQLAAAGYRTGILWVLEDNTRARHFYEQVGWIADRRFSQSSRSDSTLSEIRYQRQLTT